MIFVFILFSFSCTQAPKEEKGNIVIIHELGDPDKLQPSNSTSASSTDIESNIFLIKETIVGSNQIFKLKNTGLQVKIDG